MPELPPLPLPEELELFQRATAGDHAAQAELDDLRCVDGQCRCVDLFPPEPSDNTPAQ